MSIVESVSNKFKKVFGSRNERVVKSYAKRAEIIDTLSPEFRKLTDRQLRERTDELRRRSADGAAPDEWMNEALAVMRESLDRNIGMRSIFNPEHRDRFPVDRLTDAERKLYDQVLEEMETAEPVEEIGHVGPVPAHLEVEVPVALYEAVRRIYPESRPPFRTHPPLEAEAAPG